MNELNQELKSQAIALGLCNQWQKEWKGDWNTATLADRMYKGIDFCLQHHWPTNAFLKKNFSLEELRTNNIYIDDKRSVLNPKHSLILGKSEVKIRFNGAYAGNIYIRDKSVVELTAKTRSFVIVHLFDEASINATQQDLANITIIKHSKKSLAIGVGKVKFREEFDYCC